MNNPILARVKVENMVSSKGNKIANQFIIRVNSEGTFFQSYNTIIVAKTPKGITLSKKL
jgi:thiamine biosynthesis protein ThiC